MLSGATAAVRFEMGSLRIVGSAHRTVSLFLGGRRCTSAEYFGSEACHTDVGAVVEALRRPLLNGC